MPSAICKALARPFLLEESRVQEFGRLWGALLLANVCDKLREFSTLLSPDGPVEASALAHLKDSRNVVFYALVSDGHIWLSLVLSVLAACGVLLVLARSQRIALLVSALFLELLFLRNPFMFHGADQVLRIVSFWAAFLPWQQRESGAEPSPSRSSFFLLSAGTVCFVLQLFQIYWCTALEKSDRAWRGEYTALQMSLSLGSVATAFGESLLRWPALLKIGTFLALILEQIGPVLLFFTSPAGWFRWGVCITFMGFHLLGTGVLLRLGLFPLAMALAWWPLLPASKRKHAGIAPEERTVPVRGAWWFLVACMAFVIACNLVEVAMIPKDNGVVSILSTCSRFLGIRQSWRLFAPKPKSTEGFVNVLISETGTPDREYWFDGERLQPGNPPHPSFFHTSVHWRTFIEGLSGRNDPVLNESFRNYVQKQVRIQHPGASVVRLSYFFHDVSGRANNDQPPLQARVLYPPKLQ